MLRSSAEKEMNEWKLWREKDDDCSAAADAADDDVAAEFGYGYANVGYTIRYDFNIEYINRNRVEQTIYPSIREPDTLTIYISIYLPSTGMMMVPTEMLHIGETNILRVMWYMTAWLDTYTWLYT